MSDTDRRRWDEQYAAAATPVPAAPEALGDHAVPRGRALDVACGAGGTAVWLAQHGLVVDAVDVSPAALRAGAALADRCGVQVRWCAHDLDAGLPDDCAGPYDLVVSQRFRDPALYPALAAALAPGGLLALTVLSAVGGSPGAYRAEPGELTTAFADLELLACSEGGGLASLLARRPARQPGTAPGADGLELT